MELGNIFKSEIGGREITVEIGKYGEQANGHCIVRCGDTVVMTNVCMSDAPRPGMDFFPLSVDFEEKMYAVGKIPGSFKRREGRGSDKAILTSRLIDRPLRPLFPKGLFNDVTVVCTALSVEPDIPPEVWAMVGSSIALSVSDIPFAGPTGAVVVGYVDGEYVINPDSAQRERSQMHVTVAGTADAVMMVEAGANEVSEEVMLNGILFAHEEIKRIVSFINEIVAKVGKPKLEMEYYHVPEDIDAAVREFAGKLLDDALKTYDRSERQANQDAAEKVILEHFADIFPDKEREIKDAIYYLTKEKVRDKIINKGERPDGRKLDEIRPIWCEVGLLPRVHGSAVFTRGQSQAMSTCTLGTIGDAQTLENLDEEDVKKRYMHQYNMPGYATGEAKPLRAPGRREIGHGALAERALEPVIPSEEDFPYAIRTVSEIVSSNGSTSQASVCGSCLALMDAGVPIKAPVAGIAMGLIKDYENNRIAVMSDIQGLEDFFGDMDFKVAGTKDGITAIQMDIKIKGIDKEILTKALEQARLGRLHILGKMLEVIPEPRKELSKWAPKIISLKIEPEKIGKVIGKGGETINKIVSETGVKIDIDDDGNVFIAYTDPEMGEKAKAIVLSIVEDVTAGKIYSGPVVKILMSSPDKFSRPMKGKGKDKKESKEELSELGAFVNIAPGKDGMIHISKLSNRHVAKVTDVINVGDIVKVEVIKVDEKGRIDLKLLEILQKNS
ncbi:MAG: polyribonucleotide nucleotidyltransferase [Clostridia bacterium]|nr:polyribonucleotide nucleotidyltransferase [Clostridia bacterium]